MDCSESLTLLSDLRDDALNELNAAEVRAHLSKCKPCEGIFQDIDSITMAARVLQDTVDGITFPDEDALWQRMGLAKREIH